MGGRRTEQRNRVLSAGHSLGNGKEARWVFTEHINEYTKFVELGGGFTVISYPV